MKFDKKQNKLLMDLNMYLIDNPKLLKKIPLKSVIVPVDANDASYFRHSLKIVKNAEKEKKENVLLALFLGKNNWSIHRSLAF